MKTISLLIATLFSVLTFSACKAQEASSSSKKASKETIESKTEKTVGTEIGQRAPEIALESPDGKILKLSDLRGKYVLIDFWAAWCGPCRKENPVLVDAYAKYQDAKFKKGKGFEIYSVSLDRTKSQWEGAIAADNLTWKYHVSDLKYWRSQAAQDYGIRSIPMNYLIDPDGIIIAKNLRGQRLHKAVDPFVKSF